jgi:hypothetical protein
MKKRLESVECCISMINKLLVVLIINVSLPAIGSTSELPEWAKSQDRLIDGNEISHWGTGIGTSQEIAAFKAEFMAIRSVVQECGGYASKGIYVGKKILQQNGADIFVAYARAYIPFVECDYNKTPAAKTNKDLVNPKLIEGTALYNKYIQKSYESKDETGKLKQLEFSIGKFLKKFEEENGKRLESLEKEVNSLKNLSRGHTTIIQKNVHLHGDKAKYEECMEDYYELLSRAERGSSKNQGKDHGNLFGEHSRETYNEAVRKKYRCDKISIKAD